MVITRRRRRRFKRELLLMSFHSCSSYRETAFHDGFNIVTVHLKVSHRVDSSELDGCNVVSLCCFLFSSEGSEVKIFVSCNTADSCLPATLLMVPCHTPVYRCSSRKTATFPEYIFTYTQNKLKKNIINLQEDICISNLHWSHSPPNGCYELLLGHVIHFFQFF